MTLGVLDSYSPIASLFNCDVFALALLFLDLCLLLHVHLICANKYSFTYILTSGRLVYTVIDARDFKSVHRVWSRASTGSKASGLGDKVP